MAVDTTVQVTLPAMGESVTEGTVLEWHKQEGDRVEADEVLVEVSTDKVDAEVPAPASGTVVRDRSRPRATPSRSAACSPRSPRATAPLRRCRAPRAGDAATAATAAARPPGPGGVGTAAAEPTTASRRRRRADDRHRHPRGRRVGHRGHAARVARRPRRRRRGRPAARRHLDRQGRRRAARARRRARSPRCSSTRARRSPSGQVIARMTTSANGAAPAREAEPPAAGTADGAPRRRRPPPRCPTAPRSPRWPRASRPRGHRPVVGHRQRPRRSHHQGRRAGHRRQRRRGRRRPGRPSPQSARPAPSPQPLRGGAGMLARYMDESRSIPTATSFRTLTVTTMDGRRRQLKDAGQRVSFTHLIAYAIALAAAERHAGHGPPLRRRRRQAAPRSTTARSTSASPSTSRRRTARAR